MNNSIISALIGLCGVIIGVIISSLINFRLKTKETKLRLLEKVFDKRISAYQEILDLGMEIKTVIGTNQVDMAGSLISYPNCMQSKENLRKFQNGLNYTFHKNSCWLNTELIRELSFVCDYLITLDMTVKAATDEQLKQIGILIKQDFIDIAMKVDNLAYSFFRKDIYKLEINQQNDWHKFPKEETISRLENTILRKNDLLIDTILNAAR